MLLAITKNDAVIRLESRHLRVESENVSRTIPLNLVDRVLLAGYPQLSGAVMQQLLMAHVPVIMLSEDGRYLGEIHYTPGGNSERRRLQALCASESDLRPAKALLAAKLYNQKRVLQRLAANRKGTCPECDELTLLAREVRSQESLDALKGVEGLAARRYFNALGRFIPGWCGFSGRTRRPAKDPANALLSYGYAVMAGEMENLIRLHALDPCFGFLHCGQYDKPVLALDLMEPFRPAFCDVLALTLLTRRCLRPEHFHREANGACRLTRPGREIFLRAWERKRAGKFKCSGRNVNWQEVQNRQVLLWLDFLTAGAIPDFFKMA